MPKVLVIYHSQTGNTEAMANAICEGASSTETIVLMKRAIDATAEDLLACDVVVFGTPNNFGYMAGLVKDFFDRVWLAVQDKVVGKPYVTFGSSGSGDVSALNSVARFCNYFRLKRASEGIIAVENPSAAILERCRELGRQLASL